MQLRSQEQSKVHDDVIEQTVKKYYRNVGPHNLVMNKNGEKNKGIDGLYPDIIVFKGDEIIIIDEIETIDSVNIKEKEQWKDFSKIGAKKFILTVPKEKVHEAVSLTDDIKCEIWFYEIQNGELVSRKFR